MKKTLITLMAVASCAMGLTLEEMTFTAGNAATTTEDGTFTYALTLNVNALRNLLEKGQTTAWGTKVVEYSAGGTATGMVINGSSQTGTSLVGNSSLYAKWGTNNAWGNYMSYTVQEPNAETGEMTDVSKTYDLADLNGSAEGTGWDSVAGAGIVYSFDKSAGTVGALTLCNADGNVILSHSVLLGSLKTSSAVAAAISFGDMVTGYYYSNNAANAADALAAATQIAVNSIIPEPATATLSLLALAGLAARRRRR